MQTGVFASSQLGLILRNNGGVNTGRTVFSQLMDFLPAYEFQKCVSRYRGDHKVQNFSCRDQFLSMAFAQLTYRESLRDIETCLQSIGSKLYHMGFRSKVARSTLADANESRDWRIYADFAQVLIAIARPLYFSDPVGVELDQGLYSLCCTAIDSAKAYPDSLRRVSYLDIETKKRLKFLTNNFLLPALTIAQIYKCRWQVELFFKWIKQHLRIKVFYGTSENAVKTQIWIAVSIYVLVAIARKRLGLEKSLYQILQIFSITSLEKVPILQVFEAFDSQSELLDNSNQLILFGL